MAKASALTGKKFTGSKASVIATGQDQCDYNAANDGLDLTVIVYQSGSGVSFDMLNSVLTDTGLVKAVTGVGDKAAVGAIELDAQVGQRELAVQGAGGLISDNPDQAVAVAKGIIANM